jgi:isochorismate pyruvate lyase
LACLRAGGVDDGDGHAISLSLREFDLAMSETGDEGETALAPNAEMAALRQKIDALDAALVQLLAERQRQIEAAAAIKMRIGWPARIAERVDEVLRRVAVEAGRKNLDADLARKLWSAMIEWSIAYEERLMHAATAGATEDEETEQR